MKIKNIILMLFLAAAMFACSKKDNVSGLEEVKPEGTECNCTEKAYFDGVGEVREGYFGGEKISYEVIDGEYVFEGDIILPKDAVHNSALKSVGRTQGKWPKKTVWCSRISFGFPEVFLQAVL